jgi:predicted  nucleic acid-binding Zn-ribbon protein
MNELLTLACVLVPSAFAWDGARRWMQLSHGRQLAHDRAQAIDRQVTALQLQAKQHDERLAWLKASLGDREKAHAVHETDSMRFQGAIDDLSKRLPTLELAYRNINASAQEFGSELHALSERFAAVEQRSENTTANVAAFINETRDQIVGIQQRETMALAGLNAIGKKGIRTAP